MSIFPKLREFTPVEERFPLVCADRSGVTFTRGGQAARVIELLGLDYNGLAYEEIEGLFQSRKLFFDGLPPNITVFYQSHRQRLSRDLAVGLYPVPLAREIAARWSDNFSTSFRTRHYLVFVTANDALADQLQLLFQKSKGESTLDEHLRILQDVAENTLVHFQRYGARALTGDSLASYWAWLLNGRPGSQKIPEHGLFDSLLSGTALTWPRGRNHQIYDGPWGRRYSGWLFIKAPATATSHGLLESLFSIKRDFSVYQTFSRFDKDIALRDIRDKQKNNASFFYNSEVDAELTMLYTKIQSDELSLIRHRFAIEAFADDEEELEVAIREIANTVKSFGYQVARETLNQEALFWSRFPEMQNFNSRQKQINSLNAAHFATFASVGEGLEACTWGQAPVTLFKTVTGSEYSFIFHESTARQAPGNTIIIGGMGRGKTTLISFLMSQALKYPDFKILAFDRLQGLEVFSRFHEGSYLSLTQDLDINPLQLDNIPENRAFLTEFFAMITGKGDPASKEVIGSAINQLYELEKQHRTLSELAPAFGQKEEGSLREALNNWLPDGTYGSYYNGERDALDFTSPVIGFDMTTLLDMPDVIGPMAYYLFHKLFLSIKKANGYLVFVDELPRYLRSKEFRPKIEVLLEEVRKTEGVFIGAVQEAGAVLDDEELASKFRNSITTWILYPEPLADERHYKDILRLTDREFDWIKQDHSREVMIKRKSGESVIVNIDLSPLGRYLKCFEGGNKTNQKLCDYREAFGHEWKERYLND